MYVHTTYVDDDFSRKELPPALVHLSTPQSAVPLSSSFVALSSSPRTYLSIHGYMGDRNR